MSTWTSDELDRIAGAEELQIASVRRDGTLRMPLTIWVIRHGDDLYVRSVNGRTSSWFRSVQVRHEGGYPRLKPSRVEYMDIAPVQLISIATAMIPFIENDEATRALMGANMQRQAVPTLRPDAPLVKTGMERRTARDSGAVIIARRSGIVTRVTAEQVDVTTAEGRVDSYRLINLWLPLIPALAGLPSLSRLEHRAEARRRA